MFDSRASVRDAAYEARSAPSPSPADPMRPDDPKDAPRRAPSPGEPPSPPLRRALVPWLLVILALALLVAWLAPHVHFSR